MNSSKVERIGLEDRDKSTPIKDDAGKMELMEHMAAKMDTFLSTFVEKIQPIIKSEIQICVIAVQAVRTIASRVIVRGKSGSK